MCRDLKNCDLKKIQRLCQEGSKETCRFGVCQNHCAGDNQCTDKEKCYKDYCATACIEDRYNFIDNGRDVTAGATAVAPKFSDALTLFQPGGADSALPFQRSHHKFPRGYVSEQCSNCISFN